MPCITLKDGTKKHFDAPLSVLDLAQNISPHLAKAALAGKVNDQLVDVSFKITSDANVAIITDRDNEGLDVLRHSAAHLLAHAVKELYPDTQITIGPVIEDGFYYDFAREERFSPEDIPIIEKKMEEIAKRDYEISRQVMSREAAIDFFEGEGEFYKAQIIKNLPEKEEITTYKQGNFLDLCRGPHIPNTAKIKAFKLTKLAGAYWRGDSSNEMLQRIYGTAWPNNKSLKEYLNRLEEAEKRDHRKLAKKMDLFHTQEEAAGMIFWHANGWQLYQNIQKYIRTTCYAEDYQEIRTPQIVDESLWEKSGHLSKFGDEMFCVHTNDRSYAIKPMSCPCHVQVFKQGLKSYRDLPLRLAEFGSCHRNEASGTLHGLMRTRHFTQDDGHIFCTKEQIASETSRFIEQVLRVYRGLGFEDIIIHLSTRPEQRVGNDEIWDVAEQALQAILNQMSLNWALQEGEGAFYGPKIDFSLRDCLNRVWQCGTMQLDFSMPERLGAHYIAEDGSKQTPVMLHRAILGSLERFMGILLEHYSGNLPFWLAPVQVVLLNMSDEQAEYAKKIENMLKKQGIRVTLDLRNEKIGFKIREHTIARVPYLIILGKKEMEEQSVSVRLQTGESLGNVPLAGLEARLKQENDSFLSK